MLSGDDRAQMLADAAGIVADNPTSITIRRGTSDLDAQNVRVAGAGRASARQDSEGGQESRGAVHVYGAGDLDIQVDDRFTISGVLYRVTFVKPSRLMGTVAVAEVAE
jgi:hypothetical protein